MRRALALIAAVLLFTSTPAQAGGFMTTFDYYSDANFTQWVGYAYTNCSGSCAFGNCTYNQGYRIKEVEDCDTWEVVPDILMVAKGIKFIREPKEADYGTVAVFADLYGNQWDLLQLNDDHPIVVRNTV